MRKRYVVAMGCVQINVYMMRNGVMYENLRGTAASGTGARAGN